MLRHIVMWNLIGDTPEERAVTAQAIRVRLEALVGLIPSIVALRVDLNEHFPAENSDLVLTMDFADEDGFARYRDHPAHLEVGRYIKPLYRQRMAVDHDL